MSKEDHDLQNKRPLIITIICIFYFIFLGLLPFIITPKIIAEVEGKYGQGFAAFSITYAIILFIAMIGYWCMKNWGVYLFTLATIFCFIGEKYWFSNTSFETSYLFFTVIIFIGLWFIINRNARHKARKQRPADLNRLDDDALREELLKRKKEAEDRHGVMWKVHAWIFSFQIRYCCFTRC